jgi:hypothetical protein
VEKDYADRAADYQRRFMVQEVKRPIAQQMREASEQAGCVRSRPRPGGRPLSRAAGSMAGKKCVQDVLLCVWGRSDELEAVRERMEEADIRNMNAYIHKMPSTVISSMSTFFRPDTGVSPSGGVRIISIRWRPMPTAMGHTRKR